MIMIIIFFIIGSIVGVYLERFFISRKHDVGTLRVDTSDPDDGPYLFLQISTDPHNLKHGAYVKMKVDTTNLISQE